MTVTDLGATVSMHFLYWNQWNVYSFCSGLHSDAMPLRPLWSLYEICTSIPLWSLYEICTSIHTCMLWRGDAQRGHVWIWLHVCPGWRYNCEKRHGQRSCDWSVLWSFFAVVPSCGAKALACYPQHCGDDLLSPFCVTCLVHVRCKCATCSFMCDMTHSHSCHASFICVTWFMNMCGTVIGTVGAVSPTAVVWRDPTYYVTFT